jgi:hypothetical protein
MPKYVTLDWSEYTSLKDDLRRAMDNSKEFGWLRDSLLQLVLTPEDQPKFYEALGPLPPPEWRPIDTEEILKRVQEKFNDK